MGYWERNVHDWFIVTNFGPPLRDILNVGVERKALPIHDLVEIGRGQSFRVSLGFVWIA